MQRAAAKYLDVIKKLHYFEFVITPQKIRKKLKKEACAWDTSIAHEKPEQVEKFLDKAEPFVATRPGRRPVSIRIDPFDLSLAKRIARRKGIPFTQLMSMWLHEKIEQEKTGTGP